MEGRIDLESLLEVLVDLGMTVGKFVLMDSFLANKLVDLEWAYSTHVLSIYRIIILNGQNYGRSSNQLEGVVGLLGLDYIMFLYMTAGYLLLKKV